MDGGASGTQQQSPLAVTNDDDAEEPSIEELLGDAKKTFAEIFPTQAPRDVFGGLWSGIRCVVSGVAIGIAGAVSQPIEGARESGAWGCFTGLGLGVFMGAFFSVAGVCTGLYQALRGALVTPRAICMASKGWQWDRTTREWAEQEAYSLPEEAARILHAADDDDENGGLSEPRRRVADTFYYEQLGLHAGASEREIRQAYFQQSKRWHPDKTSEPRAKEKFQTISEAYQVLSDPDRRRAYDQQGRQGAGEGFIDARIFFNVLLGADSLEPYVGRLRLAETFGDLLFGGGAADDQQADVEAVAELQQQLQHSERAERRQVRRQVSLAVALAERLDARASPTVARGGSFGTTVREEVRALLKDPTLGRFITEIGWVYKNRADSYFARCDGTLGCFGPQAIHLQLRRRGRETAAKANTAKLALRSFVKLRKIVNEADDITNASAAGQEEEELPDSISSALPTFMETFWSLSAHDITGTLDKVIRRVLTDASVDAPARRHRAEGLRELGAAFMAAVEAAPVDTETAEAAEALAKPASAEAEDTEDYRKRRRFEEALLASMESKG